MARRSKKDSVCVRVATLLRGAADLAERSPTPLVDAAIALGEPWDGPKAGVVGIARMWRDRVYLMPTKGRRHPLKLVLTQAAQIVEQADAP